VTLQIKDIMQAAEEEAARPFQGPIAGFIGAHIDDDDSGAISVGAVYDDDDSSVWGWITDKVDAVGDFIVDHRDEIALGGALIAAGVATAVTGGLAAPIIAGAVAAGGSTLAINAASPQYPLLDGILGNTFKGGIIGLGAGSIGTAVRSVSMFGSGTAGAIAQITGSSSLGSIGGQVFGATKLAAGVTSGISTITSQGGLDIFIPEQYEGSVHRLSAQIGMVAAATDLGTSLVGNRLIRWAWNNPQSYAPFSKQFNSHHLHPKFLGGAVDGPAVLLSDKNSGFLRAIHGKWNQVGGSTVHGQLNNYLIRHISGINTPTALKSFAQANPNQIAAMLPSFYKQWTSKLMTSAQPGLFNAFISGYTNHNR
jgi:hypothetical protein